MSAIGIIIILAAVVLCLADYMRTCGFLPRSK